MISNPNVTITLDIGRLYHAMLVAEMARARAMVGGYDADGDEVRANAVAATCEVWKALIGPDLPLPWRLFGIGT